MGDKLEKLINSEIRGEITKKTTTLIKCSFSLSVFYCVCVGQNLFTISITL